MDAAAEVAETLDGLQAAARHGRQGDVGWHEKVAESLAVAAPYTSA